ncbi:hypothetical protein GLOTRDRAFT_140583 [Gloeophyllum trabeum ATCC 11539]|uniref:Uncharacterized protein n=1 Tax=Gloeophyllum trabeum (strain ATCC 11539 / FP-39264 / Madison 617) TaxID=670483 RepID=S7PX28_GLOTA|nr:uncharacterized protein GLOTRDRAFT_140583 [Gloeophyllum trabeum ATCC 11539]EPQ52166.1 hypothetical protein GLOTRDRAFT_140583 [Gloeophyllum trabeum ATCC 11539]
MNTPQSMALGWGVLVLGAGASFYYAKKGIDARRRAQAVSGDRPVEKLDWQQRIAQQEAAAVSAATGENSSGVNTSPGLAEGIARSRGGKRDS